MQTIKLNPTDTNHLILLRLFVETMGDSSKHFRYFQKRPLTVISQHLVTLLCIDDDGTPVSYGHLDKEGEDVWLGICVRDDKTSKGLGKKMMAGLISSADALGIETIKLCVDRDNVLARRLYDKFCFIETDDSLDGNKALYIRDSYTIKLARRLA